MKTLFYKRTLLGFHTILLIVCSFVLMYFDHRGHLLQPAHRAFSIAVMPLQYLVDSPILLTDWLSEHLATRRRLIRENMELKEQQQLLAVQHQVLLALEKENSALRGLLKSAARAGRQALAAEIIAVDPEPYRYEVTINKGSTDRVYVGQPLLDATGVMGQVISVGPYTSRVMLLSDPRSAIPVEDVRNGLRAIVVGAEPAGSLRLMHIAKTSDIAVGDALLTSGLGGRYPVGYPVGTVARIDNDPGEEFSIVSVTPMAQLNRGRLAVLIWVEGEYPRG